MVILGPHKTIHTQSFLSEYFLEQDLCLFEMHFRDEFSTTSNKWREGLIKKYFLILCIWFNLDIKKTKIIKYLCIDFYSYNCKKTTPRIQYGFCLIC